MRISTMLIIVMSLFILGGIGRRSLYSIGIDGKHALFFLLCVILTHRFTVELNDELSFSFGCILLAAWTFGAAFGAGKIPAIRYFIIPISAACGAACMALYSSDIKLTALISLIPAAVCIFADALTAFALAGSLPVFAGTASYAYGMITRGYGSFELTENCLTAQLLGIFLSSVVLILRKNKTAYGSKTIAHI